MLGGEKSKFFSTCYLSPPIYHTDWDSNCSKMWCWTGFLNTLCYLPPIDHAPTLFCSWIDLAANWGSIIPGSWHYTHSICGAWIDVDKYCSKCCCWNYPQQLIEVLIGRWNYPPLCRDFIILSAKDRNQKFTASVNLLFHLPCYLSHLGLFENK